MNLRVVRAVWRGKEYPNRIMVGTDKVGHWKTYPAEVMKYYDLLDCLPACVDAGVNVSLGTDGAASNNMTDMLDTIRLTALVHKGVCRDATAMSAAKAMGMATTGGAKALGMEEKIGSLEVGKKADFVLFDPDYLKSLPMHDPMATIAYSSSLENIDTTVVNGKVVYRKGVFSCGVDEAELAEWAKDEIRGFEA